MKRETRLWSLVIFVVAGIYSTLAFTPALAETITDDMAAVVFLSAMFLIALMVLLQGLTRRRTRFEIGIVLGVIAVYIMVFLRIGLAERTHLIEYSVVAVLIFEALFERWSEKRRIIAIALVAIAISSVVGFVDECIQYVIPNRHFDMVDVLFNTLAGVMAIIGTVAIKWARGRFSRQA